MVKISNLLHKVFAVHSKKCSTVKSQECSEISGELQLDRIRGSLIGGAIGDALGYPVEFISSFGMIQQRYGENGITELDTSHWWVGEDDERNEISRDKAWISDDTQMTLFTVCGILNATKQDQIKYAVCEAYLEWYLTQVQKKKKGFDKCWIKQMPELNTRRAPGSTCLTSLQDILNGREPNNNSKGCGGIMRTAPFALYGAIKNRLSIKEVVTLAADVAEITHQHPLGWLPSALEAYLIYRLLQNGSPTIKDFKEFLTEGYKILISLYPQEKDSIEFMYVLNDKALSLTKSSSSDVDNIKNIGEGWVAEETLAIAIYCIAKYFKDFESAIIASVNHGGDSDSTGTVTGNILGAVIGYGTIPQHFKERLELHDVIIHAADDLWNGETTLRN